MQNNQEDKLLLAKIEDKINETKRKNKITYSDFLNEYQINRVSKELQGRKEKNYFFFGGFENAETKIFFSYPEKMDKEIAFNSINNILKAIKIELPNEIKGTLEHRNYLGTIMSFGLAREKIGDIIVYDDRAYIVVFTENAKYLTQSFEQEKKFKKAKIEIIDIKDIESKEIKFEIIDISVNSARLDNVICELCRTSRKIAQDSIDEERVSINYTVELKASKIIKENDILIIRGKGKYIIDSFLGKNKKDKEYIRIKKYI